MPCVSVIIPAFNAAQTIGRTIAAARAQTLRDLEIIVIDDGSADHTSDIVAAQMAEDDRIRLIRQPNRGLAAARNRAIAEARGPFVAPLDADDLWRADKLAHQVEALEASDGAAMVYCWYVTIDSDDRMLAAGPAAEVEGDALADLVLDNVIGCASIPLIRRSVLTEIGGYDEGLRNAGALGCEDLKLYLSIAERHRIGVVRDYLVGYRQSPSSMSRNIPAMLRSRRFVIDTLRRRHPELPARLFALSEASILFWYARRSLRAGSPAMAASLLMEALAKAPGAVTGPLVLASLRRAIRGRPPQHPFGSPPVPDPGYPGLAAWQRRVLAGLRP